MMVTAFDFFCGAGGSSTGMVAAGVEVRGAANHWKLAIETHNTNHPHTDHFLDDIQATHPSRYPRTDIAWFSPECTNHSLAKGRQRKNIAQLDLWGEHKIDPAEERSRATMREVVEFTEFHRYQIVIVENVVDIHYWQYYTDWIAAMRNLGYASRTLYLNAMFFDVPQSRDRWYTAFWKRGNHAPALDFRPGAPCPEHGWIGAVQVWKHPDKQWGRYGKSRQYVYRCPHCGREVQPQTRPAANVIDWSLPAPRIGDRVRPLKPKTIERIRVGLRKFAHQPIVADLAHMHAAHTGKVSTTTHPLPTQTSQQTQALVSPSLVSYYTRDNAQSGVDEPLPTVTVENRHALIVPPFLIQMRANGQPYSAETPLAAITAHGNHHALIMSYYGGSPVWKSVLDPLPTQRTLEHQALIEPDADAVVEACGFRMLNPRELKLGMSFPDDYVILGSKRDQVRQVGNAVACNVAQWIVARCVESLEGRE